MKDDTTMTNPAYEIIGDGRPGPWLITCDHASNAVPPMVADGDLGLPQADMNRHIAFDIGAAGVTRHLADLLDAPAILSRFSRLVIDPNRGEDDPTLLMQLYDGTVIEGNRKLDTAERDRRLNQLYRPYHTALQGLAATRPDNAVYIAIHSFTPRLNGRTPRPWEVGILYAHDTRYARPLIDALNAEGDICVGENEPYSGALAGDSVERHALDHGRPNALIELRHDLIDTEAGQRHWAERLAPILRDARDKMDL